MVISNAVGNVFKSTYYPLPWQRVILPQMVLNLEPLISFLALRHTRRTADLKCLILLSQASRVIVKLLCEPPSPLLTHGWGAKGRQRCCAAGMSSIQRLRSLSAWLASEWLSRVLVRAVTLTCRCSTLACPGKTAWSQRLRRCALSR